MIPVVVLTGFLGAGKTTALNALIAARPALRVGVIENEAGDVSVDSDLLHGAARVVDVVGGCACCTVRGALATALELLADRAHELDAIVIEASGIADPVPIVQALQIPAARNTMALSAIVCVVDAAALAAAPKRPPHVWTRQVHFAEHILLTKVELVPEHAHPALRRRILAHNEEALFVASLHEIEPLLDVPSLARPLPAAEEDGDVPGHGFTARALRVEARLDAVALDRWVTALLRDPCVVRVKGTVAVEGLRERYVINGTPQLLETYPDPRSRSSRSRLVVIGTALDRDELQAGLDRCTAALPASA